MIPSIGVIALAALVPMVMGFIYYNPKTIGTAWMKASGMTEEKMKGANMPAIFGVSLLLSFLLAFIVFPMVVHQSALYSLMAGDAGFGVEGSDTTLALNELMELYGDRFRTFKHGAFHGVIVGIFLVFPILGINDLFERRPLKLTLINASYWTISIALMGGVICQWA